MKEKKPKTLYVLGTIACAAAVFMSVAFTGRITENVRASVKTCLDVIIPSLFFFMALSLFILRAGFAQALSAPLYKILGKRFKYGKSVFSIFLLSLIGGYPVGVKLLQATAYNNNYREIYSKALSFCYCGSPSYIITIIGLQLYGRAETGLIVYISNVLACIIIAVFVNARTKEKIQEPPPLSHRAELLTTLISCVRDSVSSIAVICGVIILFNILLLTADVLPPEIAVWIKAAGEISNCAAFSKAGTALLPVFAMLTSFGGACILVQTAALSKGALSLKYLILSRVPATLLSGGICFLLSKLIPEAVPASTPAGQLRPVFSEFSPICSICLIIMTYILLNKQQKM